MDTQKYEKNVDEIADLKKDQYSRRTIFKALRSIFDKVFNRPPKELEAVSDMIFWKQGYPAPDNEAKLNKFLDKFVILVNWYGFMNNQEIKRYLKTKGITIDYDVTIMDSNLSAANFDTNDWDEAFGGKTNYPDSSLELMDMLVNRRNEVYDEVFKLKEKIKLVAEETETEQNIKQSHVEKAGQIRMKQLLNKDIKKDLKKVEENIASTSASITIFDDK